MDTFFKGEAKLHYGDSDFTIMQTGSFVNCAVTGESIPIQHLKYWSAERQEAYKDAAASLAAWKQDQEKLTQENSGA